MSISQTEVNSGSCSLQKKSPKKAKGQEELALKVGDLLTFHLCTGRLLVHRCIKGRIEKIADIGTSARDLDGALDITENLVSGKKIRAQRDFAVSGAFCEQFVIQKK